MYRIHFDPKNGKFVLQVMRMGLFWVTVYGYVEDEYGQLFFDTFEDVEAYVTRIGLDKLYKNRSADQYQKYMAQA